MKQSIRNTQNKEVEITRTEALKKIGNYGKYATLTALSTYLILNPQKGQASSPATPGDGFRGGSRRSRRSRRSR